MTKSQIIPLCGLFCNFIGVVVIGFIVKYVQILGPYRGGLGKPDDRRHKNLEPLFLGMYRSGVYPAICGDVAGIGHALIFMSIRSRTGIEFEDSARGYSFSGGVG